MSVKYLKKTVFNRWVEAVPSKDQSATTVIKFLTGEVKTRFGIPSKISSDKTFVQRTLKQVIPHLHVKYRLDYAPILNHKVWWREEWDAQDKD